MRILQLGPFPPPHGGVQANLSALRDLLQQRGDSCVVVALTRAQTSAHDQGEVYRPGHALELLRLLVTLKADVVHLHIGGNLTTRLLLLALVCALLPGRKSVLTFHSGGYPRTAAGRSAKRFSLRGFIFRRLDLIIGVNAEIVDMFRRFGVDSARLRQIYPFALGSPDPEIEIPPSVAAFLATHTSTLISVGLLEPEYDLELQIDLLEDLLKTNPATGLLLIGSGSLEQKLRARIAAKPYRQHVLLCGDTAHDVTLALIDRCAVMLRTTLFDGDSISVREALHLGVPVVASDNGMRPDGVTLVPPADIAALAAAVKVILLANQPKSSVQSDGLINIRAVVEAYTEILSGA